MDPGAVFNGRRESDDNLRLTIAVGNLLHKAGYDVGYTRTTDVYNTPYEKAVMANNANADLIVSLHRNSGDQPNTSAGVESLVYSDRGLPGEVARNINSELTKAGFTDRGVFEQPGLVILRRTEMPAVQVAVGFINNDNDNKIFDDNFDQIANGIADGIVESLVHDEMPSETIYRVQTGAYSNRSNADHLRDRMIAEGFPAFTNMVDGLYKVQVGAFRNLENAIRMEQVLRGRGYATFITSH